MFKNLLNNFKNILKLNNLKLKILGLYLKNKFFILIIIFYILLKNTFLSINIYINCFVLNFLNKLINLCFVI